VTRAVRNQPAGPSAGLKAGWVPMNYRNTEMKLDQIVQYFNEEKINLSPAFQRGHVWNTATRRKLIANIVQGRPIPAIFLYKEASGSRYSYNILDGKQRLESLILFVGSKRSDIAIKNWSRYFFPPKTKQAVDFWIQLPTGKKTFANLDEEVIRDFREYAIPTVEINLTEESHLDEIISLFVDINREGVPVGRFDIVKAMGQNNHLLRSVFDLLAIKQDREQDVFYKAKSNDFVRVLKHLDIIKRVTDGKAQVDRMWERLLEIVLFLQSKRHRKPVDILKSFISRHDPRVERFPNLRAADLRQLRKIFAFVSKVFRKSEVGNTPLATDQTQFYTFVTTLIATDLMTKYEEPVLIEKLVHFGGLVTSSPLQPISISGTDKAVLEKMVKYYNLSRDRTTDAPRREERQKLFMELLDESPKITMVAIGKKRGGIRHGQK
jgi:hypothetical protein